MLSDDPRQVNAATTLLTRRVKTIALQVVLKNAGSRMEADDVIQDTVCDVWRQMRSGAYKPLLDVPLDAYLYRIVKNKWLQMLGKQPTELTPLENILSDDVSTEHYRTDQMQRAFDKLETACKHLLWLVYWDGYKMKEIATQLAITVEAAKERKYRCMLRLGALLRKEPL